jgi:hypothetical protein
MQWAEGRDTGESSLGIANHSLRYAFTRSWAADCCVCRPEFRTASTFVPNPLSPPDAINVADLYTLQDRTTSPATRAAPARSRYSSLPTL